MLSKHVVSDWTRVKFRSLSRMKILAPKFYAQIFSNENFPNCIICKFTGTQQQIILEGHATTNNPWSQKQVMVCEMNWGLIVIFQG